MVVGQVREIWRYPVKSMGGQRLESASVGINGIWGDRGWAIRDDRTGEIHNAKRYPALMRCAAAYRREPGEHDIPPVDITFEDGTVLGSDSPAISERLSDLMRHRVSLHPLEPAANKAFYRRREPGSALMGRLARSRTMRRMMSWAMRRGLAGGQVREEFAREGDEPTPDVSDLPPEAFEFYTPPGTYFDVFPFHVLSTSALALMARLRPTADWDVRRFRPNALVGVDADPPSQVEALWVGRIVRIGQCRIKGEVPTARCAMPTHAQRSLPRDPAVLRTIVREADQCLGLYASIASPGRLAIGDAVEL